MKSIKDLGILVGCIILCQLAGIIGSVFMFLNDRTWYNELAKPFFNPPDWVFGPVWTILYILMGISLYLVITAPKKSVKKKTAYIVFGAQLILNALWSILFFTAETLVYSSLEILILLGLTALTIYHFYPISRKAAYLLIPYILWVGFATILNISIFILNL